MLLPINMIEQQITVELLKGNEVTRQFGIQLSERDISLLLENRSQVLSSLGRIEFQAGVLEKLIYVFCDSPYLMQDNFLDVILELQEAFYYFKNESLEELGDDDLIDMMKRYFDGACEGSVEYLTESKLEELCRSVRYGEEEMEW